MNSPKGADSKTTEELPIETEVIRLLQQLKLSSRKQVLTKNTTDAIQAFQLKWIKMIFVILFM